jgi:hypothetical protein
MSHDDRDQLIEAAATAFRERDIDGRVLPSPAWMDLPSDGREEAFERQLDWRRLECTIDADGLSATAHAVLSRIAGLWQL